MKAKDTSHLGMIIGAISLTIVFIIVMIKFFIKDNFSLSVENALGLILLGISPSIPFCPIYISTWIDKIIECKEKLNEHCSVDNKQE